MITRGCSLVPRREAPTVTRPSLNNYIKPAAVKLGIQGLGWHTLRHSYKSWMAAAKISPAQMKDLMRQKDRSTALKGDRMAL
jgi:integrase